MTFTVTYRAKDGASRVLRRRKPCRRTAYRAPVCGRERIWETASLGKTRRNVAVECRVAAEFVADAFLGVEHKDGNPDVVANGFHDGREISVAGDEDKAVGASFVCVAQHRVGDVHVRHLLGDAKHLDASVGPLKVQEPGLRPAPRRLPESRRVKRPVIGGVGKCIKIRAVTQQGK